MKKSWLIHINSILLLFAGLPGLAANGGKEERITSRESNGRKKNVAILVFPGVEVLDFSGPAEVFHAANQGQAYNVYTVAEKPYPFMTQGKVIIQSEYTLADAPRPDVLIVPGGTTTIPENSIETQTWLRKSFENAEAVLTICTGSLLLARMGLLDGQAATTHHGAIDDLKRLAPKTQVVAHRRFVESGKLISSGGVSTGIDAALQVVSKLLGTPSARQVASDWLAYDWKPEQADYVLPDYPNDLTSLEPPARVSRGKVAILVWNRVGMLDIAGVAEALYAADHGRAFSVFTVGESDRPIRTDSGITIQPQYTIDDSPQPEILVVPGGQLTEAEKTPKLIAWIQATAKHSRATLATGNGTVLLARAGILGGYEVTSSPAALENIKQIAPNARVVGNRRFVDSGGVITSSGMTTGIDAALYIVDKLVGRAGAEWTARQWMEYRWQPDYAAVPKAKYSRNPKQATSEHHH